jgi:hypothetical protein
MFILSDLLTPLQEEFTNTEQGQKRKVWFGITQATQINRLASGYYKDVNCLNYTRTSDGIILLSMKLVLI